jgi:hypothetical protein
MRRTEGRRRRSTAHLTHPLTLSLLKHLALFSVDLVEKMKFVLENLDTNTLLTYVSVMFFQLKKFKPSIVQFQYVRRDQEKKHGSILMQHLKSEITMLYATQIDLGTRFTGRPDLFGKMKNCSLGSHGEH